MVSYLEYLILTHKYVSPPVPQDLRSSYYKDYVQKILKKKPNKIRYPEPRLALSK